jgi:hypothetical protein
MGRRLLDGARTVVRRLRDPGGGPPATGGAVPAW